ncbi:hypothetical protein GCK72_021182 [Caenorhabditis remanei]|uniref:F-box domain-containing protein n=1 Tax=Caenorhabditis remanei TaxID=31234 RepID=A0A6A5GJW0_CAERE|nr:hypothetical protein GCK72_021182 [Caenorhabditis remanei]KAF1754619.1 hypothetical protein GCK72_021182 [Caenorhabditis remanei]
MDRPPPESPIDLRALILYDNYQWRGAKKSYESYEKMCEIMGKGAIAFKDYKYWFKQYSKEKDRDLPIPDIRGCILTDVINRKSAEKSIDDLSEAFKNHEIDKEDHDYWFKRFENGQSFTRVTFSDFPEDVISEIIDRCDIQSYLNLRNVSYRLRAIIDQQAPPCTHIEFDNTVFGCPDVIVDGALIVEWECDVLSRLPLEVIKTRVLGVLEPLLRNPKLRLKNFTFYTNSRFWFEGAFLYTDAVIKLLNSLYRKIHVENCTIFAEEPKDLMNVLRCLKPGTLELMSISQGFEQNYINEISEMDQWKQAKHLELRVFGDGLPPMEHFLHFSTIEAYFDSISLTDIVNLCDSVSKSINLERIQIVNQTRYDTEEVKRVLNLQPTASPEVYSIPNSNLFFHVLNRFGSESFKIYKN